MTAMQEVREKNGVRMEYLIAEAVMSSRTRGAVRNILASVGLSQDTDDVVSDAAEAAVKSAGSFDPDFGPVEAWVLTIAKRRAYDHVKRAGSRSRLRGRIEGEAEGSDGAFSVVAADFSDELVDRLMGARQAREVLGLTAKLVSNHLSFRRVAALWMKFNGDVARAAAAMGITVDAMRDSRREVTRCAQVVKKALAARSAGAPVTVGSLLNCLPTEGSEDGAWATALSMAVVRAGGFGKVTATDLVEVTGYSLNTCRQYMAEALHLLQVARAVLESAADE
jgi:DNA-directed RNA polymerase specialized sigma24 family protein